MKTVPIEEALPVHYLWAMQAAGYDSWIGMEVSVMVQRQPGYDPFGDAALGYWALVHAFNVSGVPLAPPNPRAVGVACNATPRIGGSA